MYARNARGMDKASAVDYKAAIAAGSHYFGRYSAAGASVPSNSSHQLNSHKLTLPGEIASIVAAGGDFLAIDEWYETRATEGAPAAEQDAPASLGFWRSRGLHPGASVVLNLDAGYNPSTLAGLFAYYDRTNQVWGGEYLADAFYGPLAPAIALAQSGRIKHHIIPSAASWSAPRVPLSQLGISAPPAVTTWDLWRPTASQYAPAMAYLDTLCAPLVAAGIKSIIWQDGNYTPSGGDEDLVLLAGPIGSHLEAAGVGPAPQPSPVPVPHPNPAVGPHQGLPWPGPALHWGSGQYFGDIDGPAASHGGYYADERDYIRAIQDRLLWLGLVPGRSYPNAGWADGIFNMKDKKIGGPTSDAVTAFQRKYRPNNTSLFGQVWADDWATLFSLTK